MKKLVTCMALCAGLALAVNAQAQEKSSGGGNRGGGVNIGTLSCHVSSGWGLIFGSSRSLKCAFSGRGPVRTRRASSSRSRGATCGAR